MKRVDKAQFNITLLFTTVGGMPKEFFATIVTAAHKILFAFIVIIAVALAFLTRIFYTTTFSSFIPTSAITRFIYNCTRSYGIYEFMNYI